MVFQQRWNWSSRFTLTPSALEVQRSSTGTANCVQAWMNLLRFPWGTDRCDQLVEVAGDYGILIPASTGNWKPDRVFFNRQVSK